VLPKLALPTWSVKMPPLRGEVWLAEPPRQLQGREQLGARPVLVISADEINRGPSELSVVVPFTTRDRGVELHIRVGPPEGGLVERGVLLPEQVHAASHQRLVKRLGQVSEGTLRNLEDRLRMVLALDNPLWDDTI
jgi:mRNA interferase MazF